MKHEVRAHAGPGERQHHHISSTYGTRWGFSPRFTSAPSTPSKASQVGRARNRQVGIRVNAVAPGPTDTGMLTAFTGTAENKAALATQVPLGRLGLSEEVADGIVFIASTKPGSSRVTSSTSTADTPPTDPGGREAARVDRFRKFA